MDNSLSNVINYCRVVNGSKSFNNTKTQLLSEMSQDYNTGRENAIYRFDVIVNSIDGKDVYINNSITPIRGVIDVKRQQTADTEMQETVQVYPNQIKRGDYLKFKVNDTDELRDYIITSKIEKKHGYDEGIFKECNHLLKWMYKGELYDTLSLTNNATKYTEGTKAIANSIIEISARYSSTIPYNDKTKTIQIGTRVIINGVAWEVTQTDFTTDKGLLILTLGKSSIIQGVDDVDNEIANKWEIKHNYNTTCTSSLSVTKGSNCGLVYSFLDNGNPIDSSLITIENTSNLISIIKSTDGKITIIGVDIGTGSFKIKLNLTDEVREFIVNYEVVSNVVNKVDYKVTTSNGYTYRPKEGASLLATRYVNGTIDNSLIIDYNLDTNGTNLINKSSILIVKKSNTELQIRNMTITTPMSFTLTIVDKTDGTVILTQVINLKGA